MPKGKRKSKNVGIFQSLMKAMGYVPAPKTRSGKAVNVKPYVRKSPAVKGVVKEVSSPTAPTNMFE
jgi:hypothetical protein